MKQAKGTAMMLHFSIVSGDRDRMDSLSCKHMFEQQYFWSAWTRVVTGALLARFLQTAF
jgi:hypothetical protein